eukprot:1161003-Pelagomonas_calceolata.AAC.10
MSYNIIEAQYFVDNVKDNWDPQFNSIQRLHTPALPHFAFKVVCKDVLGLSSGTVEPGTLPPNHACHHAKRMVVHADVYQRGSSSL